MGFGVYSHVQPGLCFRRAGLEECAARAGPSHSLRSWAGLNALLNNNLLKVETKNGREQPLALFRPGSTSREAHPVEFKSRDI
jgi:hypothetical protein